MPLKRGIFLGLAEANNSCVVGVSMATVGGLEEAMKGVKILGGLVVVLGVIIYARFQYVRATGDISRSNHTAQKLMQMKQEYDKAKGVLGVIKLEKALVVGELAADHLSKGQLSQYKDAWKYAESCDAEISRPRGTLDMIFFEQPTDCRAMFRALGQNASLEEGGITFGKALKRAANNQKGSVLNSYEEEGAAPTRVAPTRVAAPEVPTPRVVAPREPVPTTKSPLPTTRPESKPAATPTPTPTPTCEWQVTKATFTVPQRKSNGKTWDAFGGAPDPFVKIVSAVDSGKTEKQKDTIGNVTRGFASPVSIKVGSRIRVQAFDADAASHDLIFEDEATVPTQPSAFRVGEFLLNAKRVCAENG